MATREWLSMERIRAISLPLSEGEDSLEGVALGATNINEKGGTGIKEPIR